MKVNLLQLISDKGFGKNKADTIFFCTECQQARRTLRGNRNSDIGKYSEGASINADSQMSDSFNPGKPNIASTIESTDSKYTYEGNNNGTHIHNFGIVKYDHYYQCGSKTGADNWATNWADDLLEDYDFNTEILSLREYEDKIDDIHSVYSSNTVSSNPDLYQKGYEYMADLYNDYYTVFTIIMC